MMLDYDNDGKNDAREIVFGTLPRMPYKSLLTLPGREALDVRDMLRLDAITAQTEQTWIEHETSELVHMGKTRDRLYLNGSVGADRIEIIHTPVECFVPTKPYDLVNLDLMSGITPDIGLWIERTLSRHLAPRATVVVTITQWSRSTFCAWFHDNASRLYPEAMAEIVSHYDKRDTKAEAWVMLLMSALIGFNFDQIPLLGYAGSGNHFGMTMIRADNITLSGPSDWPSFSQIIKRYEDEVPLLRRQTNVKAIPDDREVFNTWLAKSHMSLVREAGHENLYHFRDRVTKLKTYSSLPDALRDFRR
jgi:hypothetical protein